MKRGDYDFSRLTGAQEELLVYQGWNIDSQFPPQQPGKSTVKKLIARGLVIPHDVVVRGMTVTEYEVPLDVHIAYCSRSWMRGYTK